MRAKLTPKTHTQMVTAVAAGALPSDAACAAGTTYASVSRWLRLGRAAMATDPTSKHAMFRFAYLDARPLAQPVGAVTFAPEFLLDGQDGQADSEELGERGERGDPEEFET